MTIVTKPQSTEKKENDENKAKVVEAELNEKAGVISIPIAADSVSQGTEIPPEWYVAWRRRRLLTSLCATLLILWLLMAAVIGGILLFKYLHRRPVFYGWCGTDYLEGNGPDAHFEKLKERVEIDPESGYEKIEVPNFGSKRQAVFIHDFRQNLTAIVDVQGDQCFIKNLDRNRVSPPNSFIDLVQKMESGYYEQSPTVIREQYRALLPPLSRRDMSDLNSWMIEQQCNDRVSFMLQKISHSLERPTNYELFRRRRSATSVKQYISTDLVHTLRYDILTP